MLAAGSVVLLQSRHHRDRGVVLACLGGGGSVLVAVGAALVVQHPAAVPLGTVAVVVVAVLAGRVTGPGWSPRWRRRADLLEGLAVLALLPLLVVALDAPTLVATVLR